MSGEASGTNGASKPPRWRPFRYVTARPRLSASFVIFVIAGAVLIALGLRVATAILLGFDLAAVIYLLALARLFNRSTPAHMRRQAKAQDTGRWGVLWSAVVLCGVVLVALGTELHAAKGGGLPALGVGALSVVLSWLFLNIMFALHYAHGFYGNFGDKHKGLDFPGDEDPDYWDFAYFSFTIGMTFQVSDVQICTRYLRRIALMHSAIAFFFNVFIIAISVNIAAGKA